MSRRPDSSVSGGYSGHCRTWPLSTRASSTTYPLWQPKLPPDLVKGPVWVLLGVGLVGRACNHLQVRTAKFVTITEFSSFSVIANKLWTVHFKHFKNFSWTSPEVQWLRLCTSTSGGVGLIPGQGTRVPHAMWPKREWINLINKVINKSSF